MASGTRSMRRTFQILGKMWYSIMVTTDDMINAARDAFGMYLKDGVSTPRANRTTAPVKIPMIKINMGKLGRLQNSTLLK